MIDLVRQEQIRLEINKMRGANKMASLISWIGSLDWEEEAYALKIIDTYEGYAQNQHVPYNKVIEGESAHTSRETSILGTSRGYNAPVIPSYIIIDDPYIEEPRGVSPLAQHYIDPSSPFIDNSGAFREAAERIAAVMGSTVESMSRVFDTLSKIADSGLLPIPSPDDDIRKRLLENRVQMMSSSRDQIYLTEIAKYNKPQRMEIIPAHRYGKTNMLRKLVDDHMDRKESKD